MARLKSIKGVTVTVALISVAISLTGCSTPGYICPLENQPGACSSQIQAYQATLTHEANGTSIFNSSIKGSIQP